MLIDEASASASEIVSGAVQDWDRGLVMGVAASERGWSNAPCVCPTAVPCVTVQKYFTPAADASKSPTTKASSLPQGEV